MHTVNLNIQYSVTSPADFAAFMAAFEQYFPRGSVSSVTAAASVARNYDGAAAAKALRTAATPTFEVEETAAGTAAETLAHDAASSPADTMGHDAFNLPAAVSSTTTEKAKRKRRTKAEMEAANAASAKPPVAADPTPALPAQRAVPSPAQAATGVSTADIWGDDPAPTKANVSLDDVKEAFNVILSGNIQGIESELTEMLARFGVGKLRDAKPEHYPALHADLKALAARHKLS